MNIIKPKPDVLSVIVSITRNASLIDKRLKSSGIYFGTVEDIAKNLGIRLQDTEIGLVASAPKFRLQKFVEMLHFSGVRYKEI